MVYNKIINPRTGKKVSIFGKSGSSILQSYYNYLIKNETVSMKGGFAVQGPAVPETEVPETEVPETEAQEPSGVDINKEVFGDFFKNTVFEEDLKKYIDKWELTKTHGLTVAAKTFAKNGFKFADLTTDQTCVDQPSNIQGYVKPLFDFTMQTIQGLIGPGKPIKLFRKDASGNIDPSGFVHISGSEISAEELENILLVEKREYPGSEYPFKTADKLCVDLSGSLQVQIDKMDGLITDISGKTKNEDGRSNYKYETEREYIINIKSLFEELKEKLNINYQTLLKEAIKPTN